MRRIWQEIVWWFSGGEPMSHEELLARIAADTTDRDVDRFLPASLKRYDANGVRLPR